MGKCGRGREVWEMFGWEEGRRGSWLEIEDWSSGGNGCLGVGVGIWKGGSGGINGGLGKMGRWRGKWLRGAKKVDCRVGGGMILNGRLDHISGGAAGVGRKGGDPGGNYGAEDEFQNIRSRRRVRVVVAVSTMRSGFLNGVFNPWGK
jgi:hypothetical protein